MQQLTGGITNRNFRVRLGGTDYVIRLPGKRTDVLGIDREAERIATKAAAGLGIAPAVSAMLGTVLPAQFDPFRLVERYAELATAHGAKLPEAYDAALERSRAVAAAIADRTERAAAPCHNDLLGANFLHDGRRVQIIDWEYAGMGDRFFDLGNFTVNNELDDGQEARLLEAYFGEPPGSGRRAALKLFRFMSDFREGMWGVVQTALSELDFDFDAYARKHFDRLARTGSDDRFGTWLEKARDSSA